MMVMDGAGRGGRRINAGRCWSAGCGEKYSGDPGRSQSTYTACAALREQIKY